jgi:hypothetical protein
MVGLFAVCGLVAIAGGAAYLLITVGSVFFGRKIQTPEHRRIRAGVGAARVLRAVLSRQLEVPVAGLAAELNAG